MRNYTKFLEAAWRYFAPGTGPTIDPNKKVSESAVPCAIMCCHEMAKEMFTQMCDADEAGADPAEIWNKPSNRWARQYLVAIMLENGDETAVGHICPLGPNGMDI